MINPCTDCVHKDNFRSCTSNYSRCPMFGTWIVIHLLNRATLLETELNEIKNKINNEKNSNTDNGNHRCGFCGNVINSNGTVDR